jgi:hypothetical protein
MAEVELTRHQVRIILTVAVLTATGIWATVGLQMWGLRIDMQTNADAHSVCVAISSSNNLAIRRNRADTIASPLDSLPMIECTPTN